MERHDDGRARVPAVVVDGSRPWLDRVFWLRHRLDALLDGLFADVALPPGCELWLFNEADAGFGDIAFATRLLRLLLAFDPTLRLTLISSNPEKQRVFGAPNGVRLRSFADFDPPRPVERPPALVVSAPGIFDHCRSARAVLGKLGLPADTPFLYLAEYGSLRQLRDDAFKGARSAVQARIEAFLDEVALREGLDPDEMGHRGRSGEVVAASDDGVRVIDHLGRALTAPGPDNPLASWLNQPALSARSCGLEEGEIGVHIDADLVAQARALPPAPQQRRRDAVAALCDPPLRALLADTDAAHPGPLYMGYAYGGLALFCELVAAVEHLSAGPIDVVVPNARPAADVMAETFDQACCARLQEVGIGEVVVAGNGGEGVHAGEVAVCRKVFGPGRRLRLLTRHPIPNADFRALLLAAAPLSMVSGDQSFSDAVSAGKAIALMEPVYCQTFHIDSFLALAADIDADLAATLRLGMQARRDEDETRRALQFARSGGLERTGRALSARVRTDHDASGALVRAIARFFWTCRSPELAAQTRAFLADAWSRFDPAGAIDPDPAALDRVRAAVAGLPRG